MTAEMDDRTANAAAPPAETNQSLVERAYQALRAKAIDFEFRPGEAVKVLALSRQLDLSRTPVKEAFEPARDRRPVRGHRPRLRRPHARRGRSGRPLRDAHDPGDRGLPPRLRPGAAGRRDRAGALVVNRQPRLCRPDHRRDHPGSTKASTTASPAWPAIGNCAGNSGRVCARIRFFRSIDLDYQSYRAPFYDDHVAIVEALRARDVAGGQEIIARHIAISRERAVEVIKEALARIFARRGTERG